MRRIVVLALALACGGASRSKVRQVGGILSISPAAVDFGDVALGKEGTISVILQNDGIVPLQVGQLAQFDDTTFEVTGLPVSLAVGQKTTVAVRYRPTALGTHTGNLQM